MTPMAITAQMAETALLVAMLQLEAQIPLVVAEQLRQDLAAVAPLIQISVVAQLGTEVVAGTEAQALVVMDR
jgi:hypothetical protein